MQKKKYIANYIKPPAIDTISKDIVSNTTFEERLEKYEKDK